ncbi:MAG: hypothetical protein AVDCRST_MAG19-2827 [uncultured Thermomicrobiales bacterium]|uniref:Uncharacterized protein n=1 Tax=uncultured Thermomicrobiales bacterium TaxID=1645740 RepID=A0A6J4V8E4_9BACT|nr:MAG: hypothetical protein AVDCRST_MAG19-2827 [uncultured Thermomicrobiales bacterium]
MVHEIAETANDLYSTYDERGVRVGLGIVQPLTVVPPGDTAAVRKTDVEC